MNLALRILDWQCGDSGDQRRSDTTVIRHFTFQHRMRAPSVLTINISQYLLQCYFHHDKTRLKFTSEQTDKQTGRQMATQTDRQTFRSLLLVLCSLWCSLAQVRGSTSLLLHSSKINVLSLSFSRALEKRL